MRNQARVVQRLSGTVPGDCAISSVTVYELFTGIEKCSQPAQERVKVEQILQLVHGLPFDEPAAIHAGKIRALLEQSGQPIGPYDLLIAGQAVASQLVVVTSNSAEFSRIPGLTWEDWQKP
jgi:tRNA(fMet)-specific endonuclease VapC